MSLFVIMLLVFTAYHFSERWQELSLSSRSQDAFGIAQQVTKLVYEIEKESALTAGFLGGSKESLRSEMVNQQRKSDAEIDKLTSLFIKYRQQWHDAFNTDAIEKMATSLQGLVAQRHSSNEVNGSFESYSSYIESLIHQAREISGMSITSKHRDEFDAYMKLLWLIQRSGQERGITYGMIERGTFSVSELLETDNYITRQNELIDEFRSIADRRYSAMLEAKFDDSVVHHAAQLRAAVQEQVQLNELLNRLHATIGYGGLIHAFKNYVIRGDVSYEQLFHEKMSLFQLLSSDINRLNLGGEVAEKIAIIESTVEKYHALVESVEKMRKQGKSTSEIDRQVRVDDLPALEAIEYLRVHITKIDADAWWYSTTWRMDRIFEVAQTLELDIHQSIKMERQDSYRSMLYFLIFFSIRELVIGWLWRHIAYRINAAPEELRYLQVIA